MRRRILRKGVHRGLQDKDEGERAYAVQCSLPCALNFLDTLIG
jgi:hypothetical protein